MRQLIFLFGQWWSLNLDQMHKKSNILFPFLLFFGLFSSVHVPWLPFETSPKLHQEGVGPFPINEFNLIHKKGYLMLPNITYVITRLLSLTPNSSWFKVSVGQGWPHLFPGGFWSPLPTPWMLQPPSFSVPLSGAAGEGWSFVCGQQREASRNLCQSQVPHMSLEKQIL